MPFLPFLTIRPSTLTMVLRAHCAELRQRICFFLEGRSSHLAVVKGFEVGAQGDGISWLLFLSHRRGQFLQFLHRGIKVLLHLRRQAKLRAVELFELQFRFL